MLRRLVVVVLSGALVICAAPIRAFAASDDWHPLDGHYQCMWHCQERARLFRSEPRPASPSPPPKSPGGWERPGSGYGYGSGSGFFSWLTTLFGDRRWRTDRSDPARRNDSGGWEDRWRWDDRWGWDDRWDDRYWHPGWYGRPHNRDRWNWHDWSWDDGRDSGYTAHREHPRSGRL